MKEPSVSNPRVTGSTVGSSLLELAQAGDTDAFDRITLLHKGLVYHWCRTKGLVPEDAEDVVQQVFLTVFRSLHQFSRDKPGGGFRKWLRMITQSKIIDHFRRDRHREKALGGDEQLEVVDFDSHLLDGPGELKQEDAILYDQALRMMHSAFSEQDCRAFILVHVDGLAPRDAAQKLGMSVNSVYIANSRIRKRLRQEFADLIDQ